MRQVKRTPFQPQGPAPANPWAGRKPCPNCWRSDWTMPRTGEPDDIHWVCVAPQHHPGSIFFQADHYQPTLL